MTDTERWRGSTSTYAHSSGRDYVEERRELFRDLTLDEAIARARERSGGGTP
jgi:hypothetical protein